MAKKLSYDNWMRSMIDKGLSGKLGKNWSLSSINKTTYAKYRKGK
tara:strand:- start:40 stop:174 length:135 start_codon:yes stop_codon:yes gene_type:complete